MQKWTESIQRLFEDPSRNASAVTAAVAIVVVLVLIIVLVLVAFAMPAAGRSDSRGPAAPRRRLPRWAAMAVGLGLGLIIASAAVTLWYAGTSSNQYCARTCHSMAGPAESWTLSAHSDVECIRCHEGRRWSSMPRGVASRAYSLYLELSDATPRGSRVPESRCLECHSHAVASALTARNGETFLHDEALAEDPDCVRCHGAQGHEPDAP